MSAPMLRNTLVRASRQSATAALGRRAASTQALSNPSLANIEKRWESMPMQEQAELWMALRDRMKGSWTELTLAEKKAGKLEPRNIITMTPIRRTTPRPLARLACPEASRSFRLAPGWLD